MKVKLLVYGSLLNPTSATFGIGRKINVRDYYDIKIYSYRLDYNTHETVEIAGKEMEVCFLNLTEQENSSIQTKYLIVSKEELQNLAIREKNYQLINVRDCCIPHSPTDIFTFIGLADHLHPFNQQPIILEKYISKITDGVKTFDHDFANSFLPDFKQASKNAIIIQGDYRFFSTIQNNMTDCSEA